MIAQNPRGKLYGCKSVGIKDVTLPKHLFQGFEGSALTVYPKNDRHGYYCCQALLWAS